MALVLLVNTLNKQPRVSSPMCVTSSRCKALQPGVDLLVMGEVVAGTAVANGWLLAVLLCTRIRRTSIKQMHAFGR